MFNNRQKNKKITFYGVADVAAQIFLTITATEAEAKEYLSAYLKAKYESHFLSWCSIHGYRSEDPQSWVLYYKESLSIILKNAGVTYYIVRVKYALKDIATMIRMLTGVQPLNCSFETAEELEYFTLREEELVKLQRFDELTDMVDNFDLDVDDFQNGAQLGS